MNKNGNLVTHSASDPHCEKLPLVGIWVAGIPFDDSQLDDLTLTKQEKDNLKLDTLKHPSVWASLVRFTLHRKFYELRSASTDKNSFMLLNFLKIDGKIYPQMYEFKL